MNLAQIWDDLYPLFVLLCIAAVVLACVAWNVRRHRKYLAKLAADRNILLQRYDRHK